MLVLAVADQTFRQVLESVFEQFRVEQVTNPSEIGNYRMTRYLRGVLDAGPNEAYQPDRKDAAEFQRMVLMMRANWPSLVAPGVLSLGSPLLRRNVARAVSSAVAEEREANGYAPMIAINQATDAWASFDEHEREFVRFVGRVAIRKWLETVPGIDAGHPGHQAVVGFAELAKRVAMSQSRAEARQKPPATSAADITKQQLLGALEAMIDRLPSQADLRRGIEEAATAISV